jgi:hypothetical protein
MATGTRYQWFDNAGRAYGMSKQRVASLVKQYNLPKRKIWGQMAVDNDAWESKMDELGIKTVYNVISKLERGS